VPGEVLQADSRLCIATQDGTVAVEEVQAEGKARMPVAEWVRGRGARVGARFQ
jgi:methionyl-tRNA formyltransferase